MIAHVCNKMQAANFNPIVGGVVISITTPGDPPTFLRNGWDAVLRLNFHDILYDRVRNSAEEKLIPFSDEHAELIHHLVDVYPARNYLVQCDAGMSRSMAVGVFLRDCHDFELKTYATKNESATNSFVLSKLKAKAWQEQFNIPPAKARD